MKAKQLNRLILFFLAFFISNTFIVSFQIQLANKYKTQLALHVNGISDVLAAVAGVICLP